MERINSNVDVINRILASNGTRDRTIADLTSFFQESLNLPDCYTFEVSETRLVDPLTRKPVEESITSETYIDKIEFAAFLAIQSWACKTSEGTAFWVSPPDPERSSQGKIIVSELRDVNGVKRMMNRAILFDVVFPNDCISIANSISNVVGGDKRCYASVFETRLYPILSSTYYSTQDWAHVLALYITQAQDQWDLIKNGEDILLMAVSQQHATEVFDMNNSGIRIQKDEYGGTNDKSCPDLGERKSAFLYFMGKSMVYNTSPEMKCVTCPYCNQVVDAYRINGELYCSNQFCTKSVMKAA